MKVVYEDMGDVFKRPFRFLPYCPKCGAELSDKETPCRKCGTEIDWYDPYPAGHEPAPKPETDGDARKLAERILQIADDLQDKWDGGDHADMFDKVTERYIDKIAALIQSHDAALGQSAGEET